MEVLLFSFLKSSRQCQTLVDGRAMTKEIAKKLRKLLFGSSKGSFNAAWLGQNFVFSSTPGLEYGLVQQKVFQHKFMHNTI